MNRARGREQNSPRTKTKQSGRSRAHGRGLTELGSGSEIEQHERHNVTTKIDKKIIVLISVLAEIRAYLGSPQSQKVTFGNSC